MGEGQVCEPEYTQAADSVAIPRSPLLWVYGIPSSVVRTLRLPVSVGGTTWSIQKV